MAPTSLIASGISWPPPGRSGFAGLSRPPESAVGLRWAFGLRRVDHFESPDTDGGAQRRTAKMARVEAALFVSGEPLSARRLAQVAILIDATEAQSIIEALNAAYECSDSPFYIERLASGHRLLTRPEYAPWLGRIHQRQKELKLSPAAMETLTIVAYRQPIIRADVEAIRGVQCAEMLKQLMERGLVRIAGEEETLGRPYLYETTRRFLELFGLRSLDELPMAEQLRPKAPKVAITPSNTVPPPSETTALDDAAPTDVTPSEAA